MKEKDYMKQYSKWDDNFIPKVKYPWWFGVLQIVVILILTAIIAVVLMLA